AQEEALVANDAPVSASYRNGEFLRQRGETTQVWHPRYPDAPILEGKSTHEVADHAETVDHEVHRHRVTGVLGATEASFNQCEACLHKHDKIASYQGPHEIDTKTVLVNSQREVVGERFARLRRIE